MNQGYEPEPDANDLALAALLAEGSSVVSPSAGDDELLAAVASLRASYASDAPDRVRSERIWVAIQQATLEPVPVKTPRAQVVRKPAWWQLPVLRWALVTAVVLVAVWIARPSTDEWVTVVEAADTPVEYVSPDGSTVTVRPRSRLAASGSGGRAYRITGEAFFDVVHDAAHPFTVEGGGATVTVLGTRFDFGTWTGGADVFLEEGRVRLSEDGSDRTVELVPGQRAIRNASGGFTIVDGSAEEAVDWLQGALVFTSRPLSVVIGEVEHHFGIEVAIPAELEDERLTGRVMLGARDSALADLGLVLGGRFVERGNGKYRLDR